jgi:Tol biopolymer transport system component
MRLEGLNHASSNRRTAGHRNEVKEVPAGIDQTRVSPDGRWVAYNSLESGSLEVYVAAFPSFPQKRQLSAGGGAHPQWRGDGRELYYLAPDRRLMAVDVRSGATLETGRAPRPVSVQDLGSVRMVGHLDTTFWRNLNRTPNSEFEK